MLNKLGPHAFPNSNITKRWVQQARPTVAKYVGDLGGSTEAPDSVLKIGRVLDDGLIDGQGFDSNRYRLQGANPFAMAARYYNLVLSRAVILNPKIQIWSGPNEQIITDHQTMAWYANFLHEFAKIVNLNGKRALIGGWATGTPSFDLWPSYVPALKAVGEFGATLDRHEYGPLNTFLSLRYRRDNDAFAQLGFPNLPVIISECGGDNVPGSGPWKLFYKTMDRYWNEYLFPYLLEINKDHFCLGATVFSSGDGGGQWNQFDVSETDIVDRLIDVVNTPMPNPNTHFVFSATVLNVRQFPWTGVRIPAVVRQLNLGQQVKVFGVYRPNTLNFGWGCISANGDEWVSMKYLKAI